MRQLLLLDSNLDWGQDLPRLAAWMRAEGVPSVQLAYLGADDPDRFGSSSIDGVDLFPSRPRRVRICTTQPAAWERPSRTRSEMVTVCAWCQKYMGSKEPLHDPAVSHGICNDCVERDSLGDAPVLVVSRDRVEAIPVLQLLLRGAPEIAIVVDRRANERRGADGKGDGHGRPVAYVADRRATDRRRAPSFYLV